MLFSPVPAQTTFGSFGSTATVPIVIVPAVSKILVQERPSFVDFHRPPEAVPT